MIGASQMDAFGTTHTVCYTRLVRTTLLAAGLPEDRLHLETFAW